MKKIGIVGAGPCGLYAARLLAGRAGEIHIFESDDTVGGRTRMGCYRGVHVVGGAGVVRARDRLLRSLAAACGVPLRRFRTRIRYEERPSRSLDEWVRLLDERRDELDRRLDFRSNMIRMVGREGLDDFILAAGSTDYLDADVIDTLYDYGFRDNTSGQTMFGIDWDALSAAMVAGLPRGARLHLGAPVVSVERTPDGLLSINSGRAVVDALFWTAPRPSWGVLTPVVGGGLWPRIMRGVRPQPFLRAYASPLDAGQSARAGELYPSMTFRRRRNALQKTLPYRDGVYMVSYSDNRHADTTNRRITDPKWLEARTGVAWTEPQVYYFRCGTHFFTPLDPYWEDRDAFLVDAMRPARGVYLCGEGLSRNQGWTEGALESATLAVRMWSDDERATTA